MQRRRAHRGRLVLGTRVVAAGSVLLLSACGTTAVSDSAPSPAPTSGIACASGGRLAASGSSAQQNAMKHWMREYQKACPGVEIRYVPIGSGGGVAQFLRGATVLGGTDSPLKADEVELSRDACRGGRAIDLPMVGGPIAIGYNLSGVDDLVLDAPTLARIFDSEITRWDAPEIRRLNPGAALPALPIAAVHRSDESGTTQNLNAYLAGAAPEQWPYPKDKAWQAKGGQSASGSGGVASQVQGNDGAIGYVELSFARAKGLSTVRLDTGAPEPVAVSARTASAGIATAHADGTGKDMALTFDYRTRASGAYPIVLVTYEIVCDSGNPPEVLPALKSFLTYTASPRGQKDLARIHYAPLPDEVADRVRQVVGGLS
ncbi:phosphate ABC transporter substrate-binding protein PstS [Streptomyces ficellus]|uniref:Phosphate-binding protein n=1 Tax=Streptomyces ficellus TaxID=1977088 RepID=A0A6I6F9L8_9ACTN|nr:phosphate ABC transporter substrate-binding protein PstS [Streptomyces ficellus]QGV76912.1 phosphate ABC transporter substrate-binding protein PstS [Streptomyces ficellus]